MQRVLTVLFLLLGATLVGACAPSTPGSTSKLIRASEGGTILSEDGVVSLRIPPGALEQDTVISIHGVAHDDLGAAPEGIEWDGFGYRFEPEGLQFQTPARVTVRLPADDSFDGDDQIAFGLALDSAGSLEMLEGAETRFDSPERATITGDVPHFSVLMRFALAKIPKIEALSQHGSPQPVGVPWNVQFEVIDHSGLDAVFYQENGSVAPVVRYRPTPGRDARFDQLIPGRGDDVRFSYTQAYECSQAGVGELRVSIMFLRYEPQYYSAFFYGVPTPVTCASPLLGDAGTGLHLPDGGMTPVDSGTTGGCDEGSSCDPEWNPPLLSDAGNGCGYLDGPETCGRCCEALDDSHCEIGCKINYCAAQPSRAECEGCCEELGLGGSCIEMCIVLNPE